MSPRFSYLAASLVLIASAAVAADWPQWRGPDRNEISVEPGIRTDFSGDQPKLLWTYDKLGSGYSGPAVVGTTLFALGSDGGKEFLGAFDTESGKPKWRKELGTMFKNGYGDGPRSTPTVDGDYVYVI